MLKRGVFTVLWLILSSILATGALAIPATQPVKLLLKQMVGGAAHLDAVLFGARPPVKVGKGLSLKKLSK